MHEEKRTGVAVLGATGAVGQKFVSLLADHPWFEIRSLAASQHSVGRPYAEAVTWRQLHPMPETVRDLIVRDCDDDLDCPIVFSALGSDVAGPVEESFARRSAWVFSNARNHRMDHDVPLVIPELNADHLDLIPIQRRRRGWSGALVTNPNCSTIVLTLAMGPLQQRFGLEEVWVATAQAVSGAGYPGLSALEILGNVVPWIEGEEEKIEQEPLKILGRMADDRIESARFSVSAHATRVPVEEGHLVNVSISLSKKVQAEDILACWADFRGPAEVRHLPSAPRRPVVFRTAPDRPQPRLDLMNQGGMGITTGRLRPCRLLDYRFVALGHNTVRGAAGASILNAELALGRGLIDGAYPALQAEGSTKKMTSR